MILAFFSCFFGLVSNIIPNRRKEFLFMGTKTTNKRSIVLATLLIVMSLFFSFRAPITVKADADSATVTVSPTSVSAKIGERFEVTLDVTGYATNEWWPADLEVYFDGTEIDPMDYHIFVDDGSGSGWKDYDTWYPASGFALANITGIKISMVVDDAQYDGQTVPIELRIVANSDTIGGANYAVVSAGFQVPSYALGDTMYSASVNVSFSLATLTADVTSLAVAYDTESDPITITLSDLPADGFYYDAKLEILIDGVSTDPASISADWGIMVDADGDGTPETDIADWWSAVTGGSAGFNAFSPFDFAISVTPVSGGSVSAGTYKFQVKITQDPAVDYDAVDGDYDDSTGTASILADWFPTEILSDEIEILVGDDVTVTFLKNLPPDSADHITSMPANLSIVSGSVIDLDSYAPVGSPWNANGDYIFRGWATTWNGASVDKLTMYSSTGIILAAPSVASISLSGRVSGNYTVPVGGLTLYAMWEKPKGATPLTAVPDMISLYLAPAGLAAAALILMNKRSKKESE